MSEGSVIKYIKETPCPFTYMVVTINYVCIIFLFQTFKTINNINTSKEKRNLNSEIHLFNDFFR